MRRRDGGAGRRRGRRTGPQIRRSGAREIRAFDRCGARVVRLATGTRAASGLRPGAISPCQELADGGRSATAGLAEVLARKADLKPDHESPEQPRKARPDAARKNAAAERRKARPARVMGWASPAIRRQARPRGAPRVRRSAPAPVGALPPHFFERSGKGQRATRRPPNRARSEEHTSELQSPYVIS